jgi:prophage regulatory protein
MVGVARSTLLAWVKDNKFPQNHKLGKRAVAWLESDVISWMEQK